jgi:hypothetical protein
MSVFRPLGWSQDETKTWVWSDEKPSLARDQIRRVAYLVETRRWRHPLDV